MVVVKEEETSTISITILQGDLYYIGSPYNSMIWQTKKEGTLFI